MTMQTHTIEVTVPDDLLQRIDQRARARGSDRDQVLQEIIAKEFCEEQSASAEKTFDELLAPIRQGFAEGGMSEEETAQLLESELKAVRAERRARRV